MATGRSKSHCPEVARKISQVEPERHLHKTALREKLSPLLHL